MMSDISTPMAGFAVQKWMRDRKLIGAPRVAHVINADHRAELYLIFHHLDVRRRGKISLGSIRAALTSVQLCEDRARHAELAEGIVSCFYPHETQKEPKGATVDFEQFAVVMSSQEKGRTFPTLGDELKSDCLAAATSHFTKLYRREVVMRGLLDKGGTDTAICSTFKTLFGAGLAQSTGDVTQKQRFLTEASEQRKARAAKAAEARRTTLAVGVLRGSPPRLLSGAENRLRPTLEASRDVSGVVDRYHIPHPPSSSTTKNSATTTTTTNNNSGNSSSGGGGGNNYRIVAAFLRRKRWRGSQTRTGSDSERRGGRCREIEVMIAGGFVRCPPPRVLRLRRCRAIRLPDAGLFGDDRGGGGGEGGGCKEAGRHNTAEALARELRGVHTGHGFEGVVVRDSSVGGWGGTGVSGIGVGGGGGSGVEQAAGGSFRECVSGSVVASDYVGGSGNTRNTCARCIVDVYHCCDSVAGERGHDVHQTALPLRNPTGNRAGSGGEGAESDCPTRNLPPTHPVCANGDVHGGDGLRQRRQGEHRGAEEEEQRRRVLPSSESYAVPKFNYVVAPKASSLSLSTGNDEDGSWRAAPIFIPTIRPPTSSAEPTSVSSCATAHCRQDNARTPGNVGKMDHDHNNSNCNGNVISGATTEKVKNDTETAHQEERLVLSLPVKGNPGYQPEQRIIPTVNRGAYSSPVQLRSAAPAAQAATTKKGILLDFKRSDKGISGRRRPSARRRGDRGGRARGGFVPAASPWRSLRLVRCMRRPGQGGREGLGREKWG